MRSFKAVLHPYRGIAGAFVAFSVAVLALTAEEPQKQDDKLRVKSERVSGGAKQARQLRESIDVGDYYLTPKGRRMLYRWSGRFLVRGKEGKTATEIVKPLSAVGKPLAGFEQRSFGTNAVILIDQDPGGQRRKADVAGAKISLQAIRQKAGIRVDPIFVDPESGLLMTVHNEIILCLARNADAKNYFGAEWPHVRPLPGTKDQFILTLDAPTAESVLEECVKRAADVRVKWAEPDFEAEIVPYFTPNDTYFNQQWHLKGTGTGSVRAESAWNIVQGSNVVIALIDDGVQIDHPDLVSNIFVNQGESAGNGIDDDGNGYIDDVKGWSFVDSSANAFPTNTTSNHGTAVAGVAAAAGNNALGVAGVAFRSSILPIKLYVPDSDGLFLLNNSTWASAIRYSGGYDAFGNANAWRGADVINMSFGGASGNSTVDSALADVATYGRGGKGCAIFAASGNSVWTVYEVPLVAGTYPIKFVYMKDISLSYGLDTVWIDQVTLPGCATETFESGTFPPTDWTTGGNANWVQNTDRLFSYGPGSRSAQSGDIGNSQSTYLQVTKTVTAGTMTFSLMTSCESTDRVYIYTNGVSLGYINGKTPSISYPASHADTIAVGAGTDADYKAYYSQFGAGLDFLAPGGDGTVGLYTTDRTGSDGYSDSDYNSDFSGTSSASPLAAGIGALVLSANPQLSASDVRTIMRRSCSKIGDVTYSGGDAGAGGTNIYYGYGRITASAAVSNTPVATPVISPPSTTRFSSNLTVSVTCVTAGATIRFTTDGSDPTETSAVYMAPFVISSTSTVKAKAFLSGMTCSAIAEAVYTQTLAKVLYVNAARSNDSGDGLSWATAKRTIQAAVAASSDGDTVLVTNGVYNSGGALTPGYILPSRVVITNNIVVRSVNGALTTCIEGSGTNTYATASAMRCVFMSAGILDGFTLRGGATRSSDDANGFGGGVYATGGGVVHSVIASNKAYRGGGTYGAFLNGCSVLGNEATFTGGGSAYGTLCGNLVANNNSGVHCGGCYYGALSNCTVVGNVAVSSITSAGIYNNASGAKIYNCIAWGNLLSNGVTSDCYSVSYAYNTCAANLSSSNGCTNSNPMFVDAANGNYRLQSGSPCIDKGSNTYRLDQFDLDGNSRCVDGDANGIATIDMGAYEFGSSPDAGVNNPAIVPAAGTSFAGTLDVEITCATPGAKIRYTLDGSEPTTNSLLYSAPIFLTVTTTVKAKAFKDGLAESMTVSAIFTRQTVATPVFTPPTGTAFADSLTVTAACSTAGAEIRYTLDGSTPAVDSALYTGPVTITSNTTVKASAFKPGMGDSAVQTATYTLRYRLTVIGGSASGLYAAGAAVALKPDAPPPGQVLGGWTIAPEGVSLGAAFDSRESLTALVMPPAQVTLTAVYRAPVTFYVDASRPDDSGNGLSWASAKRTIQSAVNAAAEGTNGVNDVVLATNGVYNAGGSIASGQSVSNRLIIAKAVSVRSVNGAAVTFIEGSGTNYYNTAQAMRCVYLIAGVIDGFTLQGGATRQGTSDVNSRGGGVYSAGSGPTVRNCILAANCAQFGGGSYQSVLYNCFLTYNDVGSYGGGAYLSTLKNCLLTGNSATWGGGACYSAMNNCTVVGNTARTLNYGGGVYNNSEQIYNCVIWGNFTSGGSTNDIVANYIFNTCASGLTTANGNLNMDPGFVDAINDNFRLQTNSPCIDKGNNSYAPTSLSDLDGNIRLIDGDTNGTATVDMGAFEYGSAPGVATPVFTPGDGTSFTGTLSVSLSCATEGAAIRYTVDGVTAPTTNSTLYTNALTLAATTTVRAKAFKAGMPDSFETSATFTRQSVAKPTSVPAATAFTGSLEVTLVCATEGAEIRYTLDGSQPITNSTLYTVPLTLSTTTTVKAGAFKPGLNDSAVLTATYTKTQIATPVIIANGGSLFYGQTEVAILCTTAGVTIRYTTDGSDPTSTSALYTDPFALTSTTTVKARAFSEGMVDSAVASAIFTEQCVLTVVGGSGSGLYSVGVSVAVAPSNAPAGKIFGGWTVTPQGVSLGQAFDIRLVFTALVMPSQDITIEAFYREPASFYVDASRPDDSGDGLSWGAAKRTLQAGLLLSGKGDSGVADTVLVTNGVYSPIMSSNRTVAVIGVGGAGLTAIDGGGTNRCATLGSAAGQTNTVLSGFTLRNGYTAGNGGGVYGGTVCGCVLASNATGADGGAAYASVLSQCVVSNNTTGTYGSGGAARSCTISKCVLSGNRAYNGGAVRDCTVSDSLLIGNTAWSSGGGAYDSVLFNCTVAGNSAPYNSGGGVIGNSVCTNSVVWGNYGKYGNNYYGTSPTFACSCTTPLPATGIGNTDADPMFANTYGRDYRLRYGSPCLDSGTNVGVIAETDVFGNPRVMNDVVDMGACEGPHHLVDVHAQGHGSVLPDSLLVLPRGGSTVCVAQAGAFPFQHFTTNGAFATESEILSLGNIREDFSVVAVFPSLTWHVDAARPDDSGEGLSWASAKRTLQAAINQAIALDTVLATNGVYEPFVSTNKLIVVRSLNGAPFTRVSGNTTNRCATLGSALGQTNTVVVGFTLANGFTGYTGSQAYFGGGSYYGTLVNCVLRNNAARLGAGAYYSVLNNCTVVNNGNGHTWYGGGLYGGSACNCIVWGNPDGNYSDYYSPGNTEATFDYTCTTPLPSGIGNVDADPMFVSLTGCDFRLRGGSSCLDMGLNAAVVGETDAVGSPRVQNGTVDMGAFEGAYNATTESPVPVPFAWLDLYPTLLTGAGFSMEAAAMADPDGDGMAAWQEYVAGTVPTNAASVFIATVESSGDVTSVHWTPDLVGADPARVYSVYATPDLMEGFPLEPCTNVPAGTPVPFLSLSTNRFFKVGVGLQE